MWWDNSAHNLCHLAHVSGQTRAKKFFLKNMFVGEIYEWPD